MSRAVSDTLKAAVFAAQTAEEFIALITLSHADFDADICLANASTDVTSNAVLFTAYAFGLTLADDQPGLPPRARLMIDNTDRRIVDAARNVAGKAPISVNIQVVLASDPDTVEMSLPNFNLRNVTFDRMNVQGDLMLKEYDAIPFPKHTFSKANFPGLF